MFLVQSGSTRVFDRSPRAVSLRADVLKRMLPLAATMMMGAFSKQSASAPGLGAGLGSSGGGIAAMLTPLLDQNRDGSIMDDVTSMFGSFMKRP